MAIHENVENNDIVQISSRSSRETLPQASSQEVTGSRKPTGEIKDGGLNIINSYDLEHELQEDGISGAAQIMRKTGRSNKQSARTSPDTQQRKVYVMPQDEPILKREQNRNK